jgi:hypothetical protein
MFQWLSRMKSMRNHLLALVALTSFASADDKPSPQLAEVKRLIGKWSGKGTLFTEGKTHNITMSWDCVESSGAAGVRCKATILGIPNFTYQFDDLWGVSPQDGLVHWFTVTNAGEVHDHRGHLDATGGLVQFEVPSEGKLFSEMVTLKRKSNKAIAMTWNTTVGGTLKEKGELELVMK